MSVVEFGGLELATSPGRVMTPRPTSVALVERALQHIGGAPATVVDVGTGSGAIAIAIAAAASRAEVWATDVNEHAVQLACWNALHCGVGDRVHVRHGHLLEPVCGDVDVIVANLPYLGWREQRLHPDLAFRAAGCRLRPRRRARGLSVPPERGRITTLAGRAHCGPNSAAMFWPRRRASSTS